MQGIENSIVLGVFVACLICQNKLWIRYEIDDTTLRKSISIDFTISLLLLQISVIL